MAIYTLNIAIISYIGFHRATSKVHMHCDLLFPENVPNKLKIQILMKCRKYLHFTIRIQISYLAQICQKYFIILNILSVIVIRLKSLQNLDMLCTIWYLYVIHYSILLCSTKQLIKAGFTLKKVLVFLMGLYFL